MPANLSVDSEIPTVADHLGPRPEASPQELKGVLIGADQIQARIRVLAQNINTHYGSEPVVLIGVLTGTFLFFADLVRHLSMPVTVDFIGASSYRNDTVAGDLEITATPHADMAGKHVLVIDDILDGGQTLKRINGWIQTATPATLRTCVLLEKTARRVVPIQADFVGFRIPDHFVVGYGLDYAGRFRNLPFVGVLDETKIS